MRKFTSKAYYEPTPRQQEAAAAYAKKNPDSKTDPYAVVHYPLDLEQVKDQIIGRPLLEEHNEKIVTGIITDFRITPMKELFISGEHAPSAMTSIPTLGMISFANSASVMLPVSRAVPLRCVALQVQRAAETGQEVGKILSTSPHHSPNLP